MERNVGTTDRYLRLVVGALLTAVGLTGLLDLWEVSTVIAAVLLVVGVVFLGTGYSRQCLLYRPLGIDTNR
ncbi:MAG: YgaP family membrane protein [Halanaeroarchaeum sp.]